MAVHGPDRRSPARGARSERHAPIPKGSRPNLGRIGARAAPGNVRKRMWRSATSGRKPATPMRKLGRLECTLADGSKFALRRWKKAGPMMKLSKAAASCLLISLGTGCGTSSGTSSTEDAGVADGGNPTDGMRSVDGRSSTDAKSGDAGSGSDDGSAAGGSTDGDTIDAGSVPSTLTVDLGTAGDYVILAKSGISTVPASAITGDLGVSPITATAITGFSLTLDSTGVFSTSSQVTGKVYAANYSVPAPSNLTTAIGDMQTAFTDAAGRAPNVTELGAGMIGGLTLTSGVYKWSTGLLIPTNVTLSGGATDVWIFQVDKDLTVSNATSVVLSGGAVPQNVFWEVAGSVSLGTTTHFEGVILTQTMIALGTGASVHGRLLAQTEVSLEKSIVVAP